jgi:NADH dehydrogenase [ubiquinone] 1 alpha subcomplex assembly factor 7
VVDRDGPRARVTALGELLAARIAAAGPIGVDVYMGACLGDPQHGYYRTKAGIGATGDFTTAPEISQIFGELIGLWLADRWQASGSPTVFELVELGPGRGVLMQDALRAACQALPAFAAAARLHLVDISLLLRDEQRRRLGIHNPVFRESLFDVPNEAPLFLVANEFFDALPVRQFVRRGAIWRERVVDRSGGAFRFADGASIDFARNAAPDGAIVETCPLGEDIAREIARRIRRHGGAALTIDYGTAVSGWGDTLQAVRRHQPCSIFEYPGECDLTAHVDFPALAAAAQAEGAACHGIVGQGAFLARLGLPLRLERLLRANPHQHDLVAASRRLLDPLEMGTLFKVMAITRKSQPVPPGFTAALEI